MATKKDDPSKFGSIVRRLLAERNHTQAELAESLGVTPALVNQWLKLKPCPQARVDEIAGFLGVSSAYLRGEQLGEASIASSAAASWSFRRAPEDGGRDYGNSNIFATPPDIKTLVRETGQNSKDQGRSSRVHVRYTLIELRRGTREFEAFLGALRFTELRKHVAAAGNTDSRVGKKLKGALRRLEERDKLYLLRVDDFGTTGLHGEEKSAGGHNPFAALIRNNLDSSKSGDTAGGSYGLGKAVLWRCSGLSLVAFSSRVAEGLGHDDQAGKLRFIAKSELTWHQAEDNAEQYAGPGWLGAETESLWCDAAALKPLFLDREQLPEDITASDSTGTSCLIVDFRDLQSDEDLQPDQIINKLREEAAINFWPAIEAGDLSVSVEHYVGKTHKSTEQVDPGETAARPFAEAFRAYKEGELSTHPEPGETIKTDVLLTIPASRDSATAVKPGQPSHDADCTLLIRLASDEDLQHRELVGSVSMFRGRGMVVQYWNRRNIVVGGRPFHAVLMAGESAGKSEAAVAAEVFLRLSEPPAHDRWAFCEDLSDNYKPGAKSRLYEMNSDITAKIKEVIRPDDEGVQDEPEELKRLLQIGAIDTPPKLARLRHTSSFDGTRWIVDGEIKVLDRRSGIDATIAVSVVPESGSRTPLEWDTLEITKVIRGEAATLPGNRTVRIEPKTSTVRFTARSKPGPESLRLERCLANVGFTAKKSPADTREEG